MSISNQVFVSYVRKTNCNQTILLESVHELVKVVLMKHFSSYLNNEDVFSEGVLKSFEMLNSPFIDPKKNLINFLYTNIRNHIGNLVKREKRIYSVTSPIFDYMPDHKFSPSHNFVFHDSLIHHLTIISSNLLNFGIQVSCSIDHYIKGADKISHYERFALQVATVRSISI